MLRRYCGWWSQKSTKQTEWPAINLREVIMFVPTYLPPFYFTLKRNINLFDSLRTQPVSRFSKFSSSTLSFLFTSFQRLLFDPYFLGRTGCRNFCRLFPACVSGCRDNVSDSFTHVAWLLLFVNFIISKTFCILLTFDTVMYTVHEDQVKHWHPFLFSVC